MTLSDSKRNILMNKNCKIDLELFLSYSYSILSLGKCVYFKFLKRRLVLFQGSVIITVSFELSLCVCTLCTILIINKYYYLKYYIFSNYVTTKNVMLIVFLFVYFIWKRHTDKLLTTASVLQRQTRKQEAQLLLGDRATRKHATDSWNRRGNDNLGWMTFKCTSRSSKVAPIES